MTPDQIERVFVSLGEIKATIETHGEDIKKIKDTVTGNGHPEQSMVAVMHETRRVVGEIKCCQDDHEQRLKTLEEAKKTAEVKAEVKQDVKAEVEQAVKKEMLKRIGQFIGSFFKKNPVLASAITTVLGALGTWLGFFLEEMLKK